MIKVRRLIELRLRGKSYRDIAMAIRISKDRVRYYYNEFKKSGFSYDELSVLTDEELYELFNTDGYKESQRFERLVRQFPYFYEELKKTGVTRNLLWIEYLEKERQQGYIGYGYSQFCHLYLHWKKSKDVSMHLEHKSGECMFVDYAGKKFKIYNGFGGKQISVEVFVAILGASQLTYVEASYSQKKEDFIASVENTLRYFGGTPQLIICDNLRSAVKKADKYEADLNDNFDHFSKHYDTSILPARAIKPKDKAHVENVIKIAYQRIYATLRNETFYSIEQLNEAIREKLEIHNNTKLTDCNYSRREFFEENEKHELLPLPAENYEIKHFLTLKVSKMSFIYLSEDKHYYSVPHQYVGEKVNVVYSKSKVEAFHEFKRIAFHKRERESRSRYTVINEHFPDAKKLYADMDLCNIENWAASIGTSTLTFIKKMIESKSHPMIAFRSCLGVLNLSKQHKYGKTRLDNACKRALEYQNYAYKTVEMILEQGLDNIEKKQCNINFPKHDNIRGNYI